MSAALINIELYRREDLDKRIARHEAVLERLREQRAELDVRDHHDFKALFRQLFTEQGLRFKPFGEASCSPP